MGEHIACPEGWTEVTEKQVREQTVFIEIETECGALIVTPTHELTLADGGHKAAQDLRLTDILQSREGCGGIGSLRVLRGKWQKVLLSCLPTHTFYAGKDAPTLLAHNIALQC